MSEVQQTTLNSDAAESLVAPPMAEPAEEQPVEAEAPQIEQEQAEQFEQEAPEESAQPEEQQQSEQQDELPDQQQKEFPPEIYEQYAQRRYPLTPEQMQDPIVRQLLHDKIQSDIHIRQTQLERQSNGHANGNGHTPQAAEFDPNQYFAALDREIHARSDPRIVAAFLPDFLRALNIPEEEISRFTPQQQMRFAQTATRYVVNSVATFLPDLLKAALPQAFPGFPDLFERSYHQTAWDRVRKSNPSYANLPGYGSKEFGDALRLAAERIPNFDDMRFVGPDGQPLPEMENAERKYSILAQLLTTGPDPRMLAAAAAAGARSARRAEVRRSAGNLGSGQSSSSVPAKSGRFLSNNDLYDEEALELWEREHGRL